MERIRVLLVEDEQTLAEIVRDALEAMGFEVALAADGEEGLRNFFELRPDVLVTDVMMPGMSGFELVRTIRLRDRATPVLFLTAKTAVDDVVKGFELGGSDYLKKPFAMQELAVRLRALCGKVVHQGDAVTPAEYAIGDYLFKPDSRMLTYVPDGSGNEIPQREADILEYLCRGRGAVVSMRDMLIGLWGDDDFFNARSLQVLITRLRRRFPKDHAVRIINVRGVGYRLLAGNEP